MKTKFYLLLILFLFLNCYEPSSKAPSNQMRDIMTFWMTTRSQLPYYVMEDNKDGTLEMIEYRDTTGLLGLISRQRFPMSYIVKRCIQGQVYRAEQNDCKGKGTPSDWWGAEKFQWCPTNDRACEVKGDLGYYSVDKKISPAHKSCSDERFANKSWRIFSFYNYYHSAYINYSLGTKDEIPNKEKDYYWHYDLIFEESAPVITMNQTWNYGDKHLYVSKNSFNYVLCEKN